MSPSLSTLLDFRYRNLFKGGARPARHGERICTGRAPRTDGSPCPPGRSSPMRIPARSSRISRAREKRSWSPRGARGARQFVVHLLREPGPRPGGTRAPRAGAAPAARASFDRRDRADRPSERREIDASLADLAGTSEDRGLPVHDPFPRPRSGLPTGTRRSSSRTCRAWIEGAHRGWGWGTGS